MGQQNLAQAEKVTGETLASVQDYRKHMQGDESLESENNGALGEMLTNAKAAFENINTIGEFWTNDQ